jgi:peptidoglycan/LPS O-acetylase OafA/YrhL
MADDAEARSSTHVDALDGIRAVAVLAVLFFHQGLSWAGGGFLGVEAFFVLSGFLITSLLVTEWHGSGRISLRHFWARRARRLLPALFVVVAVCAVYERVAGPTRAVPDFGADVLATALYVANWHQIWTGSGYFAQTGLVSPLQHTWSLAIEEQFYLIWPLVVVFLVGLTRNVRVLFGITVVGAIASALEMAWLYGAHGAGLNRVYYGTDTRAQALLAGAALAMAVHLRASGYTGPNHRRLRPALPAAIGVLGIAGLLATMDLARATSTWLFRGGFLAVDASVLAIIIAVTSPSPVFSPARRLLETWPLRKLGLISYGVYLWHFPLFLWLTTQSTGLGGAALLALRFGSTLVVSVVSYVVIEQPIRTRRVHGWQLRALVPACTAATAAAVLLTWGVGTAAVSLSSGKIPFTQLPSTKGTSAKTCRVQLKLMTVPEPFEQCPVVSAMVVGDSLAFTLGVNIGLSQQRYGVYLLDQGRLGCGFTTEGTVDVGGTGFTPPPPYCTGEAKFWKAVGALFHAQAIIVELGYWDEAQWDVGGTVEHLGEPGFDAEVRAKMDDFVRNLATPGVPIIFLSVPWVDPPAWPNGSQPPQASASRHRLINQMLASLPKRFPGEAYYFNISPYVTPGNRFDASVDGKICRISDGIHFFMGGLTMSQYTQSKCGAVLQAALLPYVHRLVEERSPRP